MTQPSFVKDGNLDWEVLPQEYTPTDEDIQYFKTKIEYSENLKKETISQLVDKVGDPELLSQLVNEISDSHDWFISKYKKQLAVLEDALVIYKLSRSE